MSIKSEIDRALQLPATVSGQIGSKRKRLGRLVISATCLAILPAGGLLIRLALPALPPPPPSFPTATKESDKLVRVSSHAVQIAISASGTVSPEREVKISPKQPGLLKELLVRQGDYVKAGQLIALMDNSNIRGQVDSAGAAYNAAMETYLKYKNGSRPQEIAEKEAALIQASSAVKSSEINLKKLEAQLESQRATVIKDKELARRQSILVKEGVISDQDHLNAITQAQVSAGQLTVVEAELEQARESLKQAEATVAQKEEQLKLSRAGFRREEIRSALQSMEQQKGTFNYMKSIEEDTKLKAPFSGVITQKYAEVGSYVTPSVAASTSSATSSSIVVLAGRLEVVAQVPESSIASIKRGQEVEILANAFERSRFSGVVSQIAPAAVASSNVTVFEVHVRLNEQACAQLRSGMNVSTRFICGVKEHAKTIPAICVATKDGKRGVYMPGKGRPEFKQIELGAYLGEEVIVLGGLNDGDLVYKGLSESELAANGFMTSFKPPFAGGRP